MKSTGFMPLITKRVAMKPESLSAEYSFNSCSVELSLDSDSETSLARAAHKSVFLRSIQTSQSHRYFFNFCP